MMGPTQAVTVTHSSGESVTIDNYSWRGPGCWGWHRVTQVCLRILRARLFARSRGLYPVTGKHPIRTYHASPRGVWTRDHMSGEYHVGLFLGHRVEEMEQ